jgi:effector-binding domain-containing protein
MAYTCERIERPRQPTLIVRTRAPVARLPEVLGPAWGAIMAHAAAVGATPAGAPFVGYHNMDMEDLDLEIGVPFVEPVAGEGDVHAGELPAGPAVATLHVGPYDRVGEAYDALQAWMKEHGHAPGGPAYEHYLNDPDEVAPEALETRIVWPIR